jgi:hypothetical protein
MVALPAISRARLRKRELTGCDDHPKRVSGRFVRKLEIERGSQCPAFKLTNPHDHSGSHACPQGLRLYRLRGSCTQAPCSRADASRTFAPASVSRSRRNHRPRPLSCCRGVDGAAPRTVAACRAMRSALPETTCQGADRRIPPDVTACGYDDTRRVLYRQFLHEPGAFFHRHPALQHENFVAVLAQSDAEPFNMLSPAGQHQW